MIEVIEYKTSAGISIFAKWRLALEGTTRSRVNTAILRLAAGNISAVKSVGAGVQEMRLHFGPGYRVYFAREGEHLIILLVGGSKLRQDTDIALAKTFWADYKQRRKEP